MIRRLSFVAVTTIQFVVVGGWIAAFWWVLT